MTLPRLLLVTDRTQLPIGSTLLEHVEQCIDAGVTHVVLRELDLPPSVRADLAEAMTAIGATVIAARSPIDGAAGLHQASTARGPVRHLVGRSCHSRSDVERAATDRVRYATLSPFAASRSKPGYGPAVRASTYADLPIPTYALGGITPDSACLAVSAGAHGVAVMGDVMRSPRPAATVHALLDALA